MGNYVRFELLGYRWTIKPEFAQIIKEEVIPSVLSGEDSPQLSVIKRKPVRNLFIFSIDDSTPGIFVKVHKYEKPRERIKSIFRASRARAEWTVAGQMFECGLPVAEPLGLGERRSGRLVSGCVLFQRAIPGCISLSSHIVRTHLHGAGGFSSLRDAESRSVPSEGRDGLLESLGRLIRRMHSSGFWHPDLHAGNVLVDAKRVPPKLWIVDLHSAGRSSQLSHRRRMADLAKLTFSLSDLLEESRLREVLTGYEPEAAEAEIKEMLSKLLAAADSLRKRRLKSRTKRCLKTSGKFVVEGLSNKRLYRRREFDADTVLNAVNRHKEIRLLKGPELVKATSKSVVTSFALSDGSEENIYVKEFANRGLIRLLETVFYIHRARRAWKAGHRLRLLGVPCAEPIALVEEREFGLLHTSYLLMKEIPDATRLNVFLLDNYFRVSGRLSREETLRKRSLLRHGALALREFHSKNVYHKDLSAKNLLVNLGGNGQARFYCVDSDSIQFPPRLSLRRRIKNLAQLNGLPGCISTGDRIRFYKEYAGVGKLTRKHKLLITTIRLISGRRIKLSRRLDQKIRERETSGKEAYEDIASL